MHDDNLSRAGLSRDELGLETLAIRAGHLRGAEQEHGEPIYTTSSFVYGSAAEAAAAFPDLPLLSPLPWPVPSGLASTVVAWMAPGRWQVLRQGAVMTDVN